MPCPLLTVLVDADASMLLSSHLMASLVAALVCMALYALIARFVWHRPAPEMIIGALSSGFANSGTIGIPVSLYVLLRTTATSTSRRPVPAASGRCPERSRHEMRAASRRATIK